MNGKLPPHSPGLESKILGAVMIDPPSFSSADFLKPDDFFVLKHGAIWGAMRHNHANGVVNDMPSVATRLELTGQLEGIGGRAYLMEAMTSVATSVNVESHAKEVLSMSRMRRIHCAASHVAESVLSCDDPEKAVADATKEFMDAVDESMPSVPLTGTQAAEGYASSLGNGKSPFIPTGFKSLDAVFQGYRPGEYSVIAARTGVGKTSYALTLLKNLCRMGKKCLFLSLEMGADEIMERLVCSVSGVEISKIRDPSSGVSRELALGEIADWPWLLDDDPHLNVEQAKSKARRAKVALKGLDFVMIDYMGLMETPGKGERWEKMGNVSRSLKIAAKELGVCVIAMHQINRDAEKGKDSRPKLHQLRDAGCLSGDSEVLMPNGSMVPIRDLASKPKMASEVISLDGNLKLAKEPLVRAFSNGTRKTFLLETSSGFGIRATMNHEFLTPFGWKRLDALKEGDLIAVPRKEIGTRKGVALLNPGRAELLGHLLGDGCVIPTHVIQYTSDEAEGCALVSDLAKREFPVMTKTRKTANYLNVFFPTPTKRKDRLGHPIYRWFGELGLGLSRSGGKVPPQLVYVSPKDVRASFIRGLWATDGSLTISKEGDVSCYFSTSSKGMANGVKRILLSLGIWSNLHKTKKNGYRDSHQVWVQGSPRILKFIRTVRPFGRQGVTASKATEILSKIIPNENNDVIPKEVNQEILARIRELGLSKKEVAKKIGRKNFSSWWLNNQNLSRKNFLSVAKGLGMTSLAKWAKSDVYWEKVKSVSEPREEEVFDLTTGVNHCFVANGIVVHNSIEQDLNHAFLLYRKAADSNLKYEDLTSEDRLTAEVIIAKNRGGPTGSATLRFDGARARFADWEFGK